MQKTNANQCKVIEIMHTRILDKLVAKEAQDAQMQKSQERSASQNLFVSPKLFQNLKKKKEHRIMQNYDKAAMKKQITPHRSFKQEYSEVFEKAKSALFDNQQKQTRQAKHKKNISALWQSKKKSLEKYRINKPKQPELAKFYTKCGEKAVQYELKMDIKTLGPNLFSGEQTIRVPNKHKSRLQSFSYNRKACFSQSQNRALRFESMITNLYKKRSSFLQSRQTAEQSFTQPLSDDSTSFIATSVGIRKQSTNQQKRRYTFKNQRKTKGSSYLKNRLQQQKQKQQKEEEERTYHIQKLLWNPDRIDEQMISLIDQAHFQDNCFIEKSDFPQKFFPDLTANCINVSHYDSQNQTLLPIFTKNDTKRVEIASITKIMTCYLILHIVRLFKIDIHKEKLLVGCVAAKMPGTSACLEYSDTLTVYDALHGLMLPSGNDAAIALAHWGGKTIRKYCDLAKKYIKSKQNQLKAYTLSLNQLIIERKSFQKLFIFHMNKAAQQMGLKQTNFMNPHGLMNSKSYSTASDVVKLVSITMKNKQFNKIVQTKFYSCRIFNRTFSNHRKVQWSNTNKLLGVKGFVGVKTGVTPSAGPCLSSMFQLNENEFLIIVVLKVSKMQLRFKQSLNLLLQYLSNADTILHDELVSEIESEWGVRTLSGGNQEQANLLSKRSAISDQDGQEEQDEDSDL